MKIKLNQNYCFKVYTITAYIPRCLCTKCNVVVVFLRYSASGRSPMDNIQWYLHPSRICALAFTSLYCLPSLTSSSICTVLRPLGLLPSILPYHKSLSKRSCLITCPTHLLFLVVMVSTSFRVSPALIRTSPSLAIIFSSFFSAPHLKCLHLSQVVFLHDPPFGTIREDCPNQAFE